MWILDPCDISLVTGGAFADKTMNPTWQLASIGLFDQTSLFIILTFEPWKSKNLRQNMN